MICAMLRAVRPAILAAGLLVCAAGGASVTALPQACQDGALASLVKEPGTAARHYKACYEDPGADIDAAVYAHYQRAANLQALNLHAETLAEFDALLDPRFAGSRIWDRRSLGADRLGATRALIAAQAARFALGLGDPKKALGYAELALSEAAKDHRVHLDVSGEAYMLRARIRLQDVNSHETSADIVRAYVRGCRDPWVVETVAATPSADLEKINALRDRLAAAYADYLGLYASSNYLTFGEKLAQSAAAGDALYQGVVNDEAAFLHGDTKTGN